MSMDRRDFLLQSGLLTMGAMLPRFSWAQTSDQQNFVVMITMGAGWDTSLAHEPWTLAQRPQESDFFIEYLENELVPFGNKFVGPTLAPLKSYFSKLSIVNGIFLNSTDVGHPVLRYSQTGHGQGELATLPAEWNFTQNSDNLGTINSFGLYNANKPIPTLTYSNLSKGELGENLPFPTQTLSLTELELAKRRLLLKKPQIIAYNKLLKELKKDQQAVRAGQVLSAAFKTGISTSAALEISDIASSNNGINLDTHSGHEGDHKRDLTTSFEGINTLLNDLAAIEYSNGASILDHTTVVIVSDFTRTPALNNSKGKDHNPQTNSMIVMGPKIQGGQIIGSSRLMTKQESPTGVSMLVALPLDKSTQMPVRRREDVFLIRPDNVISTVYKSLGMNPGEINPSFKSVDILKGLLKA